MDVSCVVAESLQHVGVVGAMMYDVLAWMRMHCWTWTMVRAWVGISVVSSIGGAIWVRFWNLYWPSLLIFRGC